MKLFHNARFHSLRREGEVFQALLVEGGVIREAFARPPQGFSVPERVDLRGTTVLPGFIDTHTHSFEGGLYTLAVDLSPCEDLEELWARLSAARPLQDRIFAWRFDETRLREGRFPTPAELDRVWPEHPLLLRRVDGHSCVLNSAALSRIPWNGAAPDTSQPLAGQDNSEAVRWFHAGVGEEWVLAAYQAAAREAIKGGCTTVHTMVGNGREDPLHYSLIAAHLAELPVEFILYPQIISVRRCLELGSPRIGGCLLVDGSFGSHTAALREAYADRPESRGRLYREDAYWEALVREAQEHGLQVAVHAIGDAAIAQILRVYLKTQGSRPRDLRHQIIHNELVPDSLLEPMREAGIVSVMQPRFDALWGGEGGLYARLLGQRRALLCNRLASLAQRGILITGSSDWYITELEALKGIEASVRMHNPAERLSPFQALQLYSTNAARLSLAEGRLGNLLPGYQADMVCLSNDPLSAADCGSIAIRQVLKAGRPVGPGFLAGEPKCPPESR